MAGAPGDFQEADRASRRIFATRDRTRKRNARLHPCRSRPPLSRSRMDGDTDARAVRNRTKMAAQSRTRTPKAQIRQEPRLREVNFKPAQLESRSANTQMKSFAQ